METGGVLVGSDSFTACYDEHARTLLRFCARRVGPQAAEDVVATAFLVAYERWQQRDPSLDARPWLYGIAVNVLRRHRRDEIRAYRTLAKVGVDPLFHADGVLDGHEQRAGE
jgi:RNA polymerase sigma-70 factor (ECF subfamily)